MRVYGCIGYGGGKPSTGVPYIYILPLENPHHFQNEIKEFTMNFTKRILIPFIIGAVIGTATMLIIIKLQF